MSTRHEFDSPYFPQASIWENLTANVPLYYQAKDRQTWAIAAWAMADLASRQVYLDESITPAVWLEILSLYRAGDLADIGNVIDHAIRTQKMCERVDKEAE